MRLSRQPASLRLEDWAWCATITGFGISVVAVLKSIVRQRGKMGAFTGREKLLFYVTAPFVVALACFEVIDQGIPLVGHTFSRKTELAIDVIIVDKVHKVGRSARFHCDYQLQFQHPGFNRNSYACIDRARWEVAFVDRPMTLYVEQSPFAYTIKKVVLPDKSVSRDDP